MALPQHHTLTYVFMHKYIHVHMHTHTYTPLRQGSPRLLGGHPSFPAELGRSASIPSVASQRESRWAPWTAGREDGPVHRLYPEPQPGRPLAQSRRQ